jgi:serine protease
MTRRLVLLCGFGFAALAVLAPTLVGQEPPAVRRVPIADVKRLLEGRRAQSFVPGEVIVKLRTGAGLPVELSSRRVAALGLGPILRTTAAGELVYSLAPALMALPPATQRDRTLTAVEALKADPNVEYAQPNFILRILDVPNDPLYRRQWHYLANGVGTDRSPGGINLPQAWTTGTGSSAVTVAVIDTGVLPAHPDISGSPNLVAGYDMISDSRRANDGGGRDADATDPGDAVTAGECGPGEPALPSSWHGSHVSGTVGVGRSNNGVGIAGVNWNVRVQAVRVLGKCGGTIEDINDAIRWAAGLAVPSLPANATPARVINMSLGGSGACSISPSTQRAIDDAVAAGTTVVVAAGNDASDAGQSFPASCNGVITVGATDFRGYLARYSNYGAAVEILAPGGDVDRDDNDDGEPDGVLSLVQGGYAYYNGTSMATPHVAGVAALVLAANPSLTPAQVLTELTRTSIPRSTVECPTAKCTSTPPGLLNAYAPFLSVSLQPPARTSPALRGNEQFALTATVRQEGTVVGGKTVSFSSTSASVASVSPATATTDGQGQATATVTAQSNGSAAIRVEVEDTTKEVPVRVPVGSVPALLALAAAALWTRRRRAR